jgi:hypothetical protein
MSVLFLHLLIPVFRFYNCIFISQNSIIYFFLLQYSMYRKRKRHLKLFKEATPLCRTNHGMRKPICHRGTSVILPFPPGCYNAQVFRDVANDESRHTEKNMYATKTRNILYSDLNPK